MMRTRALAAVLLTASLGLAACGGGDDDSVADLSATKILAKTNTAVADAEDITVKGEGASNGTTLKIELGFAEKDTTGTIDFNGAELTVLGVDGKTYLKSTPEVYQSFGTNGAKIAEAIGDKWIIIKADDANLGSFAQFGVPVSHPERVIDTVLAHATDERFFASERMDACNVLDVAHPLWLARTTGYRSAEVAAAARTLLDAALERWQNGAGVAFGPGDEPGLQGTEMWLAITWYLADLLGLAEALGYRPRGVHRPEPADSLG